MSIGMSPFEVLHGYKLRKPIDLILVTHHPRISESASAFISYVHDLHEEINKKIQVTYIINPDLHCKHLEFNEGDSK